MVDHRCRDSPSSQTSTSRTKKRNFCRDTEEAAHPSIPLSVELQSAILRTLLANKDSDLVSAATSATQGHNSKATELRRDNKTKELDNLGEPHVHLWGSIVHHIIEHGKITSAEKEVLSQHLADATPKDLEGKVLVARCKKCYDPRKMRFVMCVASDTEPILDIVVKAMLAEGAILKRGVAPRTGNDREIQSILDTLVQETS